MNDPFVSINEFLPPADGYQKAFMGIYPKVVTPNVLTGSPAMVSSGFPIEPFGNDSLLELEVWE
jgi:hypothetical protein